MRSEYHGRAEVPLALRISLVHLRTKMRCNSRRISVSFVDGSAAGRVDQMYAATGQARHRLIALPLRLVRIIGDPALHAQPGFGAAEKECNHGPVVKNGRDRNRAGCLGDATVRSGPLTHWVLLLGRL